jgi:HEAT repeat protein
VVIAVAFGGCLAWLAWMEARDRGWIPGIPPPPKEAVDGTVPVEPLNLPTADEVPELIATLADGDMDDRRMALLRLSSIGPPAAEALEAIREQLHDESPGLRHAALIAVSRICRDPDTVVPLAAPLLDDDSSLVTETAAQALEGSGPRALESVMQALHGNSRIRARAVLMLRRIMLPGNFAEISNTIRALRDDPDPGVRAEALMFDVEAGLTDPQTLVTLLETDYTSPAVHASANLTPRGGDRHRNSRDMALCAAACMGPEAAAAVPALIAVFEEEPDLEPFTPRMGLILEAFSSLRSAAAPAIPHLTARLDKLSPVNRPTLIGVLFDIGADPHELTPRLTSQIAGPGDWPWHASAAARQLVRVNPAEARWQVSLIVAYLDRRDQPASAAPLTLLQAFGPEAREAVPTLIRILSHDGGEFSYSAAEALGAIGPRAAPAVPSIVTLLEGMRRDGKILAYGHMPVEALGKIGTAAGDAVRLLLELVTDARLEPTAASNAASASWLRERVMSALVRIAPDSPEVAAAIRSQLESDLPRLREAAVFQLAALQGSSSIVLGDVVEVLVNDSEPVVRAGAALRIARMSGDRTAAIAPLVDALGDAHPEVQRAAAVTLGSMGVAARAALPTLRETWIDAQCGLFPTSAAARRSGPLDLWPDLWPPEMRPLRKLSLTQTLYAAMRDIDPGTQVTP